MILDTNAISAFADGEVGLLTHLRTAIRHSVPTIVLGEYRHGLRRSRTAASRNRWLSRLELEMDVLDVTSATARFYADVKEELRSIGRPIPENDVWIAALSREHGLAVLSRDGHFDHVPGLMRLGW